MPFTRPNGSQVLAWSRRRRVRAWPRWSIAAAAIVFGVATIVAGGRVLFGDAAARTAAGAYVPFVVAFNFEAGFVYVAAGIGLALRAAWARWLGAAIAGATVVMSLFFAVHVAAGGRWERRTAIALALRSAFWMAFAIVVPRYVGRPAARDDRAP